MITTLISNLAESGPSIHVAPAGVWQIGGLTITNSILFGWICMAIICAALIGVARHITVRPKGGFSQFIEAGAEFIVGLVESNFTDKAKGRKYVAFFVTLFFFILINNWLGLLPGVGDALHVGDHPLLRPFTADLNGTLAVGIFTMGFVYISSIRELGGFRKYIRHFFIGSPWNPLYFVIGILEMITDLTRVLSLSLRLFLNVTIGEIVIAVFAYLGHIAAPLTALPFTLVELFVGALQAYIFTVLSLMYLAIAVNHGDEHHGDASEHADEELGDLTSGAVPETIGAQGSKGQAA